LRGRGGGAPASLRSERRKPFTENSHGQRTGHRSTCSSGLSREKSRRGTGFSRPAVVRWLRRRHSLHTLQKHNVAKPSFDAMGSKNGHHRYTLMYLSLTLASARVFFCPNCGSREQMASLRRRRRAKRRPKSISACLGLPPHPFGGDFLLPPSEEMAAPEPEPLQHPMMRTMQQTHRHYPRS
jgi:hypothetical protein